MLVVISVHAGSLANLLFYWQHTGREGRGAAGKPAWDAGQFELVTRRSVLAMPSFHRIAFFRHTIPMDNSVELRRDVSKGTGRRGQDTCVQDSCRRSMDSLENLRDPGEQRADACRPARLVNFL